MAGYTGFTVNTPQQRAMVDVTSQVQRLVQASGVTSGVCFVFCPHTTAALALNENWDPAVEQDALLALKTLVPTTLPYRHAEGNSPAHVQSLLLGNSHAILVEQGQLMLGTWQGIFLVEFDGPRQRQVWVKVMAG